jgi:ribosomal protein S18 acetylase RimI-like enzyme
MRNFFKTAAAVADSLIEEPFYRAITADYAGDSVRRRAVLCAYLEYSLAEAQRTGRLVLAPRPEEGAAAWLLPRTPEIDAQESAAKARFLRAALGPLGYANYQRMVGFMAPLAEAVVPPEAWYLSILGVLPAMQGRGIGAKLLLPTLAEADAAGAICYLESFSERNPAFYRRLGFETVATHREPTTGSPYSIMMRARA